MWLWLFYLRHIKTHIPAVHHTDGSSAPTEANNNNNNEEQVQKKTSGSKIVVELCFYCDFLDFGQKKKEILIK